MKDKQEIIERYFKSCKDSGTDADRIADKVILRIRENKRKKRRIIYAVSAAAVITIAVFSAVSLIPRMEDSKDYTYLSETMNTFSVPYGATASLYLQDGTKLVINSGSEVSYPRNFSKKERRISVRGEVYLDVASDSLKPFIVETPDFYVKVLGTEFNINTSGLPSEQGVVLVEGAIEIRDKSGATAVLSSGQMATFHGGAISVKEVCSDSFTCWTDGYINIYGKTLEEIAEKLSSHYGVPVICEDSLPVIYGKLALKNNLYDVLNNIKRIANIDIVKSGDGYILKAQK